MTQTTMDPTPIPPAPQMRRLERDEDDKIIAGVCAGFGRYTNTDPVIWRVTLAVLTVFGGSGFLIYALGWVFIPKTTETSSRGERLLKRPRVELRGRKLMVVAAAIFAVVVVAFLQHRAQTAFTILAVAAVFALTMRHLEDRNRKAHPAILSADPTVVTTSPLAAPLAPSPTVVVPPPPRSKVGQITLSVAALVSGILVALRINGTESLTAPRIVVVALVIVGVGGVIGTWIGRGRWLIAVAVLLALSIVPAALAEDGARDGIGTRSWVPTANLTAPTYRLGIGEGRLDLSGLPKAVAYTVVDARVKVGHLLVTLPPHVRVHIRAHTGIGEVLINGASHGGTSVDQDVFVGPAGGMVQELNLRVGIGQVEVRDAS